MISSETTKSEAYAGTGAEVAYPIPFAITAADQLLVTVADAAGAETVKALNSYYTVNSDLDTATMTVPSGYTMVLSRDMDLVQETAVPTQGNFNAHDIEDALDYLTMCLQQLAEEVSRSAKVTITGEEDPTIVNAALAAAAAAAASAASAAASAADALAALADLATTTATANAALPKAGGTMTGQITAHDIRLRNGEPAVPALGHIRMAGGNVVYDDTAGTKTLLSAAAHDLRNHQVLPGTIFRITNSYIGDGVGEGIAVPIAGGVYAATCTLYRLVVDRVTDSNTVQAEVDGVGHVRYLANGAITTELTTLTAGSFLATGALNVSGKTYEFSAWLYKTYP